MQTSIYLTVVIVMLVVAFAYTFDRGTTAPLIDTAAGLLALGLLLFAPRLFRRK